MSANELKAVINIVAATAAFVAAILWWCASVVVVRPADTEDWMMSVDHKTIGEFDPLLTNIKQSRMNRWAAMAASLAASLQGAALLIPGS